MTSLRILITRMGTEVLCLSICQDGTEYLVLAILPASMTASQLP